MRIINMRVRNLLEESNHSLNTEFPNSTDEVIRSNIPNSSNSNTELFSSTSSRYNIDANSNDTTMEDLLVKVLAVTTDSLELLEESNDKSEVQSQVDKIIDKYNDQGSADIYDLKLLVDAIRELSGSSEKIFESVDKLVELDYNELIRESVVNNLTSVAGSREDTKALRDGEMSPKNFADKYNQNDLLDQSLSRDTIISSILERYTPHNPESKEKYQQLVNDYRTNSLNSTTFTQSARVLDGVDPEDINRLEEVLKRIEENTDPENNKLNHADEIREAKRKEAEIEAFQNISDQINNTKASDKSTNFIKNALKAGSNEELGENLVDSIWDNFVDGGDDYGDDRRRRDNRGRDRDRGNNRRPNRRVRGPGGRGPGGFLRRGMQGLSTRMGGMMGSIGGGLAGATSGGGMSTLASTAGNGLKAAGGGLANVARVGAKGVPLLSTAVEVGSGIYDYANAEDDAGRTTAMSKTGGALAGAAAGAAIGSVVPIIGTGIGAVVGGILGAWGGEWFGDKLTDPQDKIPDETKKRGPMAELNYIDNALYPTMYSSINSGDSQYDKDDLDKLMKYRNKLIEEDIPKWMKDNANQIDMDDLENYNSANRENTITKEEALQNALSSNPSAVTIGQNIGRNMNPNAHDYSQVTGDSGSSIADGSRLGSISTKYETGGQGVGTISKGDQWGDPGGVSYGSWQLASKTGTMQTFVDSKENSKYKDRFKGLTPGTPEFNKVYSDVVKEDAAGFENAQFQFLKRTHYDPVEKYAREQGMDVENPAVKEALWSMSMGSGLRGCKIMINDWRNRGGAQMSFEDSMRTLYAARGDYTSQFVSASASTDRFKRELGDVLSYGTKRTGQSDIPPFGPVDTQVASTDKVESETGAVDVKDIKVPNDDPTKTVANNKEVNVSTDVDNSTYDVNPFTGRVSLPIKTAEIIDSTEETPDDIKLAQAQGMTDPMHIAMATNRDVSEVKEIVATNDVPTKSFESKSDESKKDNPVNATMINNTQSTPAQSSTDIHKLSDDNIKIAALLRG